MTEKLGHVSNEDAWGIGEIGSLNRFVPSGDYIDTGLSLVRLLRESGYDVVRSEKQAPSFLPTLEQLRENVRLKR